MADQVIWFGTEGDSVYNPRFEWLPCPQVGLTESRNSRYDALNLDSGGLYVNRSNAGSLKYEINVAGEAMGLAGVDLYHMYASGQYGNGRFFFANPMYFDQNMFPAHWANPSLAFLGHPFIGPVAANGSWTASTSLTTAGSVTTYNLPQRSVFFNGLVNSTTPNNARDSKGTFPLTPYCLIPIPAGYALHVGVTGVQTGTARVRWRTAFNGTAGDLTLMNDVSTARFNTIIGTFGNVGGFALFTLEGGATPATASLTLNSMMAQLWPVGVTPQYTNQFIQGSGHTGLEFGDSAVAESYTFLDLGNVKHLKAMSTSLVEVGAWEF